MFTTIVNNVSIPTVAVTAQQNDIESHEEDVKAQEDKVFLDWISDVLQELARGEYAKKWQRNNGNSI